MFSVEHDFDRTTITLTDNDASLICEDVWFIFTQEGITIKSYDPDDDRCLQIDLPDIDLAGLIQQLRSYDTPDSEGEGVVIAKKKDNGEVDFEIWLSECQVDDLLVALDSPEGVFLTEHVMI